MFIDFRSVLIVVNRGEMASSEVNNMRGDRDTFSMSGFSDRNDAVGDSRTVPAATGAGKGTYRSFLINNLVFRFDVRVINR